MWNATGDPPLDSQGASWVVDDILAQDGRKKEKDKKNTNIPRLKGTGTHVEDTDSESLDSFWR